MNIRDATDSDLEAITSLIIRCSERYILLDFPEEGVRSYLSSHSVEKMQERLKQFHYQVLEDDFGEIVGVVGMQRPSHLYHLHVAPEFHGHGYGRRLWNAAKRAALTNEKPRKFTVNSSVYAVPFYERLGFVFCGGKETKNGVTYVPMSMDL